MTQYDLGQVVGADGQDGVDGSDGSTIWYTSTAPTYANSKYTFTISNLSGKTGFSIAVSDLIFYDTYYYIVSAVGSTTVDCATRVSIKGSDASVTVVDNLNSDSSTSVLSAKQGKVLNTNKVETSAIVTSFSSTTSDSKIASEKLVKTELDKKIATSSTTGLVKNDGSIDTTSYLSSLPSHTHGDISNDGVISTSTVGFSDLDVPLVADASASGKIRKGVVPTGYIKDDTSQNYGNIGLSTTGQTQKQINTAINTTMGNKISKSSTSGLMKNDGTVDTTSYSTFSGSYTDLTNKPSIPSSSSDLSDGSSLVKTSSTTGLIKNDGTIDTTSYSTFSGSYSDLSNKPSIPSSSSDLSDGSDLVKKSSTTGLLKNDGTVDTTSYLSSLPSHNHDDRYYTESEMDTALSNKISKSGASGLVRNDGTIDASNYITSSALSGYQTTSNLVTSFSGTTSDSKYPSQKLVKDSLDGKQATLVSGTSIKTINNESILGSGNISVGGGSSVDIVTSWETTPSDSKVASEKLVKDTIDDIEDLIGEAIQYINQ